MTIFIEIEFHRLSFSLHESIEIISLLIFFTCFRKKRKNGKSLLKIGEIFVQIDVKWDTNNESVVIKMKEKFARIIEMTQ